MMREDHHRVFFILFLISAISSLPHPPIFKHHEDVTIADPAFHPEDIEGFNTLGFVVMTVLDVSFLFLLITHPKKPYTVLFFSS